MADDDVVQRFASPEHTLITGFLSGHFMKLGVEFMVIATPEGDYTPEMLVNIDMFDRDGNKVRVRIAVLDPREEQGGGVVNDTVARAIVSLFSGALLAVVWWWTARRRNGT